MKHVFVIAAALFICVQSISAQDNVGFKYKNEIELRSAGFVISEYGFNLKASGLYRRFLSEKFALQSEFGLNSNAFFKQLRALPINSYNRYNFGLGTSYFLNSSHNGLYFTAMLTYHAIIPTANYNPNHYWSGRVGAGYRISVGKYFYVAPEMNLLLYGQKRVNSEASLSVGLKF
jgi:hypothetical protein